MVANVLYTLLQELSQLQGNLIVLDKILDSAARATEPRSSVHILRSLNAEMNDGELKLSVKKLGAELPWKSSPFDESPEGSMRSLLYTFKRCPMRTYEISN